MKTQVTTKTAQEQLISGVNILADAVKITLGAAGQTVIIEDNYGNPHITKDGVTVAKSIYLEDPIQNMGAMVVRQAASRTANDAGDGTTTSTVIAQRLIEKANALDKNKYILSEVKKGMEMASEEVQKYLDSVSVKVDNSLLLDIATISANNDPEIGEVIAKAFEKAGENGVVTMDESATSETYVEQTEGLEFDRGYSSRHFINQPEKEACVFENSLVFLCDIKVQNIRQITHILEFAINSTKPIVIVADMEEDVLNTIILNKVKGGMKVCVVKPPMFGIKRKEIMEDLAVVTGAIVVSDETGDNFENVGVDYLGGIKKLTVDKHKTTMLANVTGDNEVEERIEALTAQIAHATSKEEKEWLQERIAKLSGGVAIVYVGASSEIEMKEKKDRVDDAIHATRAAIEEGIVSGGGVALFDASFNIFEKGNKNINAGYSIVIDAVRSPIYQIITNSGKNAEEIIQTIIDNGDYGYGYNVKTESFGNMMEMGIIDPLKVTKNALKNAVSVASTIMSTGCTITNVKRN